MRILELTKGLSYFTPGMNCKAERGKPFEVEDELADRLMNTGRFIEKAPDTPSKDYGGGTDTLSEQEETSTESDEDGAFTEKDIDNMKMSELLAIAVEKGIDISECNNNDARKAVIKAALFANDPFTAEE
jgi:hypothetical protein